MNRPAFAVVTDSTCDIAPEIAREYGVDVVPLSVTFGDETLTDGAITQEEFFARMTAAPELPKTSQPPIGLFIAAFERALENAEQVVCVSISNRLSGTIESARQAAEHFAGKVHVFDSRNLSWGLGFQVLDAAQSAREGLSVDAALERLARVRERVHTMVALDSLDNLAKGGRIGRVSAFLGSILNIKVTLEVDEDGAFQPLARNRGEKAAIAHTLEWVDRQMQGHERGSFAVGHALSRERAERLAQMIRERYQVSRLYLYEAGSVICTHTGTGWGVMVLPEG